MSTGAGDKSAGDPRETSRFGTALPWRLVLLGEEGVHGVDFGGLRWTLKSKGIFFFVVVVASSGSSGDVLPHETICNTSQA